MDKETGKQLLITGLIILFIATIVVFTVEFNKLLQYHVVILALSLASAMIVSQIPNVVFDIKLPVGVNATGSLGFATLIFWLLYSKTDIDTISKGQPLSNEVINSSTFNDDCKYPKVKISILCSANDDYNRTILIHLLNALEQTLPVNHKKCLSFVVRYWNGSPYDSTTKVNYFKLIESSYQDDTDYYVSIGTSASIAYKTFFKDNDLLNKKKLIFLGVTDPIGSGLVNSLTNRNEQYSIAGVSYCGNFEMLPILIQRIYPDDKLVYIYNKRNLQDKQIGDKIKNMPMVQDKILTIKELDREPIINDFEDNNVVYFSWLTVENMFRNQSYEEIYKIDKLVSTTATQVEQGLVPFAVTTSDSEIGRKGAQIISSNLEGVPLKKMDIFVPEWKIYVNCKKANVKNIPQSSINLASIKIDDENCN